VGLCASLDSENTGNNGMSSETGKERAWTQCKGVKDAQGSPMAMRADYNKDMTRRAGRVIAQLGAGALLLVLLHALRQLFLLPQCSARILARTSASFLHSSSSNTAGLWRGSTKCNAESSGERLQEAICWCCWCCQAATILAIGHWDVGRL
jgi:hypothetical protein